MRLQRRWERMSTCRRTLLVLVGAVQMVLAIVAWRDLAKRPADQVNGCKGRWAWIIAIDLVGPLLYFTKGRTNDRPAI